MKNIKKKIGYLTILCIISVSVFQIFNLNNAKNFPEGINHENIHSSAQESYLRQWIENPNFTSGDNWTSSKGILGDPDDLEAKIDTFQEQANLEVIGETYTKRIDDPINIANMGNWDKFNKTEPAINPDVATIDNNGFYVSHSWHDATADQFASVYWRYDVAMGVDMSEYEIISASINATMYANVDPNIDTEYDTYARFGPDYAINQPGIFDHATFIVEIADINLNDIDPIAYNQTIRLGKDTAPTFYTIADKSIEQEGDEDDLIYFLNKAFENDPGHDNFTIIVGIEISCEDDYSGQDFDDWDELRVRSLNLTFTYERKIEQLSSISWNQVADKPSDISNDTVVVDKAILNFRYMINDTWTPLSQNSKIQVLINDITHTETINLWEDAKTFFQDAKSGGFDVTYLIEEDKNINLSIQLYIADDFKLNRTIAISIDNISLDISYTVYFSDYQTNLELFLNGENKTLSPSFEIPIGKNLTITVKYSNLTGTHIPGAEIQLTGIGIIENLKEYANNYSITINATQQLNDGVNYLEIEANKTNYETRNINPTIHLRKIIGEIRTVSGESTINIDEGDNLQLEIMLNDTDNDELIKGAIVTYIWDLDSIPRVLTENNGIYEGEIINPPEGLYTIIISVFAGEDYEFEDFPITLNVGAYVPGDQPDLGLLIYILTGGMIGLVVIFTLYQTHFKFPPLVRKIRKLKKKISKGKKTHPLLVSNREETALKNFKVGLKVLEPHIRIVPEGFKNLKDKSLKKEDEP
ncbi:MAG: hypothetical protein ACFFDB_20005 [Promethearchaeota archaeon]